MRNVWARNVQQPRPMTDLAQLTSEVHRLYKDSTWNVATPDQVGELARQVDFVFVGVFNHHDPSDPI